MADLEKHNNSGMATTVPNDLTTSQKFGLVRDGALILMALSIAFGALTGSMPFQDLKQSLVHSTPSVLTPAASELDVKDPIPPAGGEPEPTKEPQPDPVDAAPALQSETLSEARATSLGADALAEIAKALEERASEISEPGVSDTIPDEGNDEGVHSGPSDAQLSPIQEIDQQDKVGHKAVKLTYNPAEIVNAEARKQILSSRRSFTERAKTDPSLKPVMLIGRFPDGTEMPPELVQEDIRGMLATIPNEWTISFKAPVERLRLYVFTDVTCPYCKKLHKAMDQITAEGITVHYVFYPRDLHDIRKGSKTTDEMFNIWCAPDQKEELDNAFDGYKVKPHKCEDIPASEGRLESPVFAHFNLAKAFGVSKTPTMFASNGAQTLGFRDVSTLLDGLHLQSIQKP